MFVALTKCNTQLLAGKMTRLKQLLIHGLSGLALAASPAVHAGYIGSEAGYHGTVIAPNLRATAGADPVADGDDISSQLALPFAFTFYGQAYAAGHNVWISTNGVYCCDAVPIGTNAPIGSPPHSSPTNSVQAGWFDLTGRVTTITHGTVGSRELVLNWSALEMTENDDDTGAPNLFQVILHEGSNNIEFQIAYLQSDLHVATVGGIRGGSSSAGLDYIDAASGVRLNDKGLLITAGAQDVVIPEPGSLALLGLGLMGAALARRRAQRHLPPRE
jgi:hypothetical protein